VTWVRGLARLVTRVDDLCPDRWYPTNYLQRCVQTHGAHWCVGDVGHGGKHVCPCGALRDVHLPSLTGTGT
jgi:hypothetical protein